MSEQLSDQPSKEGRCWWLSPHKWTKWRCPNRQKAWAKEFRICRKCGRNEMRFI